MSVKERSDLRDLVYAATKATFNTRTPNEVDRCVDVLYQLKTLSLSVNDILFSESIFKLESLKKHRNPKIRKEAQVLFASWHKTLDNAQAKDNSFRVGLIKLRLKMKKPLLTTCSELKNKQDQISLVHEATKLKKRDGERSQTHLKKESFGLMKTEDRRCLTHEVEEIEKKTCFLEQNKQGEKERKTDPKPLNSKRKAVTIKQTEDEHHKMCSDTVAALPHRSRQNIKDKGRQASATNTSSVLRRDDAACKKQQYSGNPKSAALKTKAEDELKKKKTEFLELFEVAKKAADVANAKGLLLGKAETSRCVEALSLLMKINITPKPQDSSQMMKKLDGLTHHKDRKICNAASALLQLWRQRITDQQRKHSAT